MKCTLFVTEKPYEELTAMVEALQNDATEYSKGMDVRPFDGVPGKYDLIPHNGEQDLGHFSVRVHESMMIAGKARGLIERMLRRNKVHFRAYQEVGVSEKNANSQTPNIRVPRRDANLIYNP